MSKLPLKERIKKLMEESKRLDEESRKRREKELAKMTPEERKAELDFQNYLKEKDERRAKELQKLESKLTEDQKLLRGKVETFKSNCATMTARHIFDTNKEEEEYTGMAQQDAAALMDKLLKTVENDVNKIKNVLTKEEWEDFEMIYKRYLENRRPLMWRTIFVRHTL